MTRREKPPRSDQKLLAISRFCSYRRATRHESGGAMARAPPSKMKRFIITALAVVLVAAACAAAVPLLISTDVVKRRIADQITNWTGRVVSFEGDPRISLYPYVTVR